MRSDVRESVYTTIKGVIQAMGLEQYFDFREANPKIICRLNGNQFIPLGLNEVGGKSGTGKSIFNPTDAFIEEADEITEDEFDKLSLSLRGSKDLEEILLFNPPPPDHWIIKRYFPESFAEFEKQDGSHTIVPSKLDNVAILHTNYKMNPYCTESERERHLQIKVTNPDKYKGQGLGLLIREKMEGLALPKFNEERHVRSVKFDPNVRAVIAWDFNRYPHHTVSVWQCKISEDFFDMVLIKEFCLPNKSVREVQREALSFLKKNSYISRTIRYIGDYSGGAQRDHDTPSMAAKILDESEKQGFEVIDETKPNPSVVASLDFLNDIFAGNVFLSEDAFGRRIQVRIQVSDEAVFHIEDLQQTKTAPDGRLLKVRATETFLDNGQKVKRTFEKRGHAIDVMRYVAVGVLEDEFNNYINYQK